MAVDVMIVDNDAGICRMLSMFVREIGYTVSTVESSEKAISLLPQATPRLVLLDFMMPDMDGLQVLQRIKQDNVACKVVMMSGYNTAAAAVQAMQLGAETYLTKPTPLPELGVLIERLLDEGRQEPIPDTLKLEGVIGRSPAMQEVYRQVHRVAGSRATVLIRGASGTGKDLIAQAIHGLSAAASKPFVQVDCTNIPHNLIETELFGRQGSSGTGQRKKGLLEEADWGTLFLDEISLMPLEVQDKLLNLLETYRFQQVGGNQYIPVSVRILAATNDDLEKAVGENRFREDLYYRLNIVPIDLPELRQRQGDIVLLTEHFLAECAAQYNTEMRHLDTDAQALLQSYPWPGNVRELKNVIERAVLMTDDAVISASSLIIDRRSGRQADLPKATPPSDRGTENASGLSIGSDGQISIVFPPQGIALEQVERLIIATALEHTAGNVSRAANLLHLSRDTLRYRINRLDLQDKSRRNTSRHNPTPADAPQGEAL